jgi:hypothetical protein
MSALDIRKLLEGYCLDKAFLTAGKLHVVSETEMTLDGLSGEVLPYALIKAECLPDNTRILSLAPLILDNAPTATGDFDAIITQFKSVSDAWIIETRDCQVIPLIRNMTGLTFDGIAERKEWHSGTDARFLFLNNYPIIAIKSLNAAEGALFTDTLAGLEIRKDAGVLVTNGRFVKGDHNIVVEYTYGYAETPADIKRAVALITASLTLGFIAAKTGGGSSVSTQGYSRSFGNRGKFTEIRNDFDRWAYALLQPYYSGVTIL